MSRQCRCFARYELAGAVASADNAAFPHHARRARLLKSAGVNGISLNDVNACGDNANLLASATLRNVTRNLGPIFRRYAITPYFAACWASPTVLDNVTSDPRSADAQKWWSDKADEVFAQMPEFGGWLVKADSECGCRRRSPAPPHCFSTAFFPSVTQYPIR